MKLVSFRRLCTGETTASGRLARDTTIARATGATSTASWRSFTLFKVNTEDDGEKNMALRAYRCGLSRPMPAAM
jgi:hypothetical protein